MRSIKKGATSQSVYFEFLDSTSTTGARKTGMVFNTSGLTAYYARNGAASAAITLATQTASGAWSSGGFAEVDGTNMPGLYRLDVPNAAFASGAESVVITLKGATSMAQASLEIALVDNNSLDIYSRLGAPAGASVSADIAAVQTSASAIKTQTDKMAFTVTNQIDCNVLDWKSATAPAMTGDAFARLGAPAGASISADIAAAPGKVWDITLSGHLTASTTGNALNAAGSAGDPWSTALPGAYGAGSAGNIIGNRIDAAISSRFATGGYTAPDNTSIAAIKAKTDNLPAAPADESLIIAATSALASSIAVLPTANANADALLDRANGIETGWTLRQVHRIIFSALGGKASGMATSTAKFRDVGDTKDRITATVDADGNRSAVALDAS